MEDLSLHIMDIAENSIRAGAHYVEIELSENEESNTLILKIIDSKLLERMVHLSKL